MSLNMELRETHRSTTFCSIETTQVQWVSGTSKAGMTVNVVNAKGVMGFKYVLLLCFNNGCIYEATHKIPENFMVIFASQDHVTASHHHVHPPPRTLRVHSGK